MQSSSNFRKCMNFETKFVQSWGKWKHGYVVLSIQRRTHRHWICFIIFPLHYWLRWIFITGSFVFSIHPWNSSLVSEVENIWLSSNSSTWFKHDNISMHPTRVMRHSFKLSRCIWMIWNYTQLELWWRSIAQHIGKTVKTFIAYLSSLSVIIVWRLQ